MSVENNLAWSPSWRSADFFSSPANHTALRAVGLPSGAEAVVEIWQGGQILLLLGDEGAGKTHLAHIWAEKRAERGEGEVIFLRPSMERSDWHDIALRLVEGEQKRQDEKDEKDKKDGVRRTGAGYVIDGVESVLGEREREVGFLHFLDAVRRSDGARLLLTARSQEPLGVPTLLPDLRSRLAALARCQIGAPDDLLLEAILLKLFSDRQVRLEAKRIETLMRRMERSYAAAGRIVAKLDEEALRSGKPISPALVRTLFAQDE